MLELKNIYKQFPGTSKAFYDGLSLNIEKGSFVVIVGSNGSGKSSLLNLISGQLTIDSGEILLDGKSFQGMPSHKRFAHLARVYQDPQRMTAGDMTVFENLSLAYDKGKLRKLQPLLEKERMPFFQKELMNFKMGLEDKLNVQTQYLSGGQRQALALLMASFHEPKLLLLDEHTAALDPKSHQTVMTMTDQIVREKKLTTIMVTHSLEDALCYGDRLLVMHRGKLIRDYSKSEKEQLNLSTFQSDFQEMII